MGTHVYRKPEPVNVRGICVACDERPQRHKGKGLYAALCATCHRRRHDMRLRSKDPNYGRHKKSFCEECGFVASHPCQLDVDHIDGNHSNDDPNNLRTLCANCHRLKTWLYEDWKDKD